MNSHQKTGYLIPAGTTIDVKRTDHKGPSEIFRNDQPYFFQNRREQGTKVKISYFEKNGLQFGVNSNSVVEVPKSIRYIIPKGSEILVRRQSKSQGYRKWKTKKPLLFSERMDVTEWYEEQIFVYDDGSENWIIKVKTNYVHDVQFI